MEIIEVYGLKKRYGKIAAVKGIDFSVRDGALFALLGPNGAGKSTTISVLCALQRADEGEIRINGWDPEQDADEVRRQIGVVFQESLLDKNLTVEENLNLRARLYHHEKPARKEAVQRAVSAAGLEEILHRPYGKLSGGQRRRCDIARALLGNPQILFLDEPTTGLDPQTRIRVWETIGALQKERGMTVFLTTHYMEEAERAGHVVIMDEGVIAARGSVAALKDLFGQAYAALIPGSGADRAYILHYLDKAGINWREAEEQIILRKPRTCDFLPVLQEIGSHVCHVEIRDGTLEDVFLTVTGKELRE